MVLKELILNSFYFGRVWSLERTDFSQFLQFLTGTFVGCADLERTDF